MIAAVDRDRKAAWLLLGACLIVGCGRIGFDDVGGTGIPTDPYSAAVLDDAPIAYWRFGERTGTVARDEMGNYPGAYRGTCQLAVAGIGGGDTAVRFDGSSCRAEFGDVLALAGSVPYAIELWANPDLIDTSVRWLVSRDTTTGGPSTGYHLAFHDGELWFERFADGAGTLYLAAGRAPVPNQFQFITLTFDGMTHRIYVDAIELNSNGVTASAPPADAALFLGDSAMGNAKKFSGVLDEIAIYDHALPAARVAAHFAAR